MSSETKIKISAEDNASNEIKKVSESMKGFVIGYDLLKEGLKLGAEVIKGTIEKYNEMSLTNAQLDSVLRSTAGAAGMTRDSVLGLSDALAKQSNYEGDAITGAQNMLLTFTKIGKDAFPEATKAVLDMSTAMGSDLKSTSIQVGKALNDPITGITALHRVGVTFTDSQKEMIKTLEETGHHLDAQKIILKELQTEFGGSAEAARNTFAGAMKQVQNQGIELQETIGGLAAGVGKDLVESMAKSEQGINEYLKSAKGLDQIGNIAGTIAGSFAAIKMALEPIGNILKQSGETIMTATKRFDELSNKSSNAGIGMDLLKGASVGVGTAITIASGAISILIGYIVDLIKYVEKSADVIKDVFAGNWKKAGEDVKKVWEELLKTGTDIVKGTQSMVGDAIKTFDKLNKEIDPSKLQKAYNTAFIKIKSDVISSLSSAGEKGAEAIIQPMEKAFNLLELMQSKSIKNIESGTSTLLNSTKGMMDQYYTNALASAEGDAEKTKEIKRQQFNMNKATSAVTAAMNTAQAITSALTIPPPAGEILAGIVGTEGLIQTGLILAQPMPSFATGGIVPGNSYSGDNVIARVNSGEGIFTREQMAAMGGSSGDTHIHFHGPVYGMNDFNDAVKKATITNKRNEYGRGQA